MWSHFNSDGTFSVDTVRHPFSFKFMSLYGRFNDLGIHTPNYDATDPVIYKIDHHYYLPAMEPFAENRQIKRARVRTPNQKITAAARAIAERKTVGDLSSRVEIRRQSLSLPNILSIRLRHLSRRLSYLTVFFQDLRPGMQGFVPLSTRVSRNQSASYPLSARSHAASGRPFIRAAAPV